MAHRVDALDPVFVGLSRAGEMGALWLALGLAAAVALRRPILFPLVGLAVLVAHLSTVGLKETFDRPRPPARLPEIETLVSTPTSDSFPSGHASISFAAAVVLCAALPRLAPVFLLVAAGVAFSRPYVGVHYPADVLVGAALGALLATALLLLERALRRSRSLPTPAPPTGPRPD